MKTGSFHSVKRGFLLLEVVLALGVFGIAATGFAIALHRMSAAAQLAQSELRITRILESALDEALSDPTLTVGVTNSTVAETGIEIDTLVELLDKMETDKGQLLQEMYLVRVTAHWFENGVAKERSVETWRYGRMYQPS